MKMNSLSMIGLTREFKMETKRKSMSAATLELMLTHVDINQFDPEEDTFFHRDYSKMADNVLEFLNRSEANEPPSRELARLIDFFSWLDYINFHPDRVRSERFANWPQAVKLRLLKILWTLDKEKATYAANNFYQIGLVAMPSEEELWV